MTFRKLSFLFIVVVMAQPFFARCVLAASPDYIVADGERIPIPTTYLYAKTIYNAGALGGESGYFKEPQDLFINAQGYLYVADTGNNRIVKLSADGKMAGVYRGAADRPLQSPSGIFADDMGDMYIADTGNARIVHLSDSGEFVEQFTKPESELLQEDFAFAPKKILISPTGTIYVVRGQNIMTIDANNRFKGFLGQTPIGFNLVEALLKLFASEEQRSKRVKRTAAAYTNIAMDDKGIVYATSWDPQGEIKKLNSLGNDLYQARANKAPFGERLDPATGESFNPRFTDITVDDRGFITVLEETLGKLYQYDQDGNLLTVFGGKGEQLGGFTMPVSVELDRQGRVYVLDAAQGNIHVFEPTRFIESVHRAIDFYSQGEYAEAFTVWSQVLTMNENYQLARLGLANALYKQEKWKAAMDSFKLADDRGGYSKAFTEYRYQLFRHYFGVIVLAIVVLFVLFTRLARKAKLVSEQALQASNVSGQRIGVKAGLLVSLGIMFHPLQTFQHIIQARGRLNVLSGWIILLTVLAIRVIYLLNVHYPLGDRNVLDSSLWLEAVKLLLPPLTWVIASFFISSILDGESKIGEIFVATCYCMIPYIVMMGALSLLSNVLSLNESSFYSFFYDGTWLWVLLLFFISLKVLNDYTVFRTSVAYAVSGLTMGLLWFVGLLGYALSGRLVQFIDGIVQEVRTVWM
ncbi:MAG: hypothetical protein J7639_27260 [Paenibacillaceae bacterium]|nr:hypothetical protein [Paenibacillaceae bacterium]